MAGTLAATLAWTAVGCAGGEPSARPTEEPVQHRAVAAAATTTPSAGPTITSRIERKRRSIPYRTAVHRTKKLKKGVTRVARKGRAGVRVQVYRVTLTDGVVTSRRLVRTRVARKPVTKIVLKGTRTVSSSSGGGGCDPNYAGACVPIASDVDCAGGSGDGPAYVEGPVQVVGNDIYDLDRDGDGWGCDT